jgi:hypothetical protein
MFTGRGQAPRLTTHNRQICRPRHGISGPRHAGEGSTRRCAVRAVASNFKLRHYRSARSGRRSFCLPLELGTHSTSPLVDAHLLHTGSHMCADHCTRRSEGALHTSVPSIRLGHWCVHAVRSCAASLMACLFPLWTSDYTACRSPDWRGSDGRRRGCSWPARAHVH